MLPREPFVPLVDVSDLLASLDDEKRESLKRTREEEVLYRPRPVDLPDLVGGLRKSWRTLANAVREAGDPSLLAECSGELAVNLMDVPLFLSAEADLELFWVSSEMVEVLDAARKQLSADTIPNDAIPEPISHGFAWFEKPLFSSACIDPGLGPVPIRGYAWLGLTTQVEGRPRIAVGVLPLGYSSAMGRVPIIYSSLYVLPGNPLDAQETDAGCRDPENAASAEEDAKVWVTLLSLLGQRIVESSHVSLPRSAGRRAQRQRLPAEVRVVRLRRSSSLGDSASAPTAVDWSHRWVVSGHWRNQAVGPNHSERRMTWVSPHIKGPDGKPLLLRPSVGALVR